MSPAKSKTTPVEDLSTKAMLVRLSCHGWGARVRDGEVENEVSEKHQNEVNTGIYIKKLLKSDSLDAYWSAVREVVVIHKRMTLPWDIGTGLLPAALYWKYNELIEPLKTKAASCADKFAEEYAAERKGGFKTYRKLLGGLFNEEDYPESERVRRKFEIRVRIRPIENPNDFRVNLGRGHSDQIKNEMAESLRSEIQDMMKEPFHRLYDVVRKVNEKLSDADSIFRDSLIENVKELVEVLPDLNVTNDPELTALIASVDKELCSVADMKALRKDKDYRKKVAKSAADILGKMKGYEA